MYTFYQIVFYAFISVIELPRIPAYYPKPFRQNGIIGKVIIETCEEFIKALNEIKEP